MDNSSKKDRFKVAYQHLKNNGKVHTQVELAKVLESSEATISKAMKGDEKSLTDKFLFRFNKAFGNIFNTEWLINGVGDMMCSSCADVNHIYESNVQTNVQGDNSTNTQIIGSTEALIKENEMLKKLLEEKERTIQLLLNR